MIPSGQSRPPLRGVSTTATTSIEPIAACEVTVDGRRARLRPGGPTDTIADLALALGTIPGAMRIDGVVGAGSCRLVDSALRTGSAITTSPGPELSATTTGAMAGGSCAAAVVELAVVAGPCCTSWRPLPPGRHTVGRAVSADIRLDDATVELHHGILDVDDAGSMMFIQLTGRVPVRIDGQPCEPAQPVVPGRTLLIGASRIDVRSTARVPLGAARIDDRQHGGSVVAADRDPWRRIVRRGPTVSASVRLPDLDVPDPLVEHRAPPLVGLVGAGVAAGGAGVLAAALGQAMFALFAAVGAVASLATWAVGAVTARRRRRRAVRVRSEQTGRFADQLRVAHTAHDEQHRTEHRSVVEALEVVADDEARTWERRVSAQDPLRVSIGRGSWHRPVPLSDDDRRTLDADLLVAVEQSERLDDVAVPLVLAPSTIVALHGDLDVATASARAIAVQLAATYGPADWQLVVVSDRRREWEWTTWLPHSMTSPAATVVAPDAAMLGDLAGAVTRPTVVITDVPAALAVRTGALRRFLDTTAAACIVVTARDATVPAVCGRVLELGSCGRAEWRHHDRVGEPSLHLTGISRVTALAAARRLAPLIDPEAADLDEVGLPCDLTLGQVTGPLDSAAIAGRWATAGTDPALVAPIGRSADGVVELDLVRDGPHGLLAGTTGAGKSELLRTLIVSLATCIGPDHLSFVLVDFKGGSTFDTCVHLPHVVGVVTDLDDGLAERALVSLDAEIRRRERLLRAAAVGDLTEYRRAGTGGPLPRLVVVVDEFAALAKELPDFLTALVGIAQRGRSLGIHLLLATQRPAGVVTDDIRANTSLRLALRLHDRADAVDVVGDALPANFPRGVPGRAALRLAPEELVVFQTASCSVAASPGPRRLTIDWLDDTGAGDDDRGRCTSELSTVVAAVGDAALLAGTAAPHRPWLDPLPRVLHPADLCDRTAIGSIDDPSAQTRRSLRWDGTNHVLLVGSLGSGTTSAAIAAVASVVRSTSPADRHVYVLDGAGDAALDAFVELAHCGGVVRVNEVERTDRLLRRLVDEIDQRALTGRRQPGIVLVVDALSVVRAALASIERADAAARLDRVLGEGPAVGIVVCATTDGTSVGTVSTIAGERWVFHLDDPSIARAVGVRVEPAPAVPGRLVLVDTQLAAQIVCDPDVLDGLQRHDAAVPRAGGPEPIVTLPDVVDPTALGPAPPVPGATSIVVGIDALGLDPAVLEIPSGDHVLIAGASRTGASTALRQLAASWRDVHPGGTVVAIDRATAVADVLGSVTGRRADDARVLVAVDDADRVDDPTGELAALAAGRRPGVTVAAAARLEAVRVAYGHWLRDVARSRCGLILTSTGEVDGELLGATLPRRTIIAARPGLAWLIDRHGHRLVQVAARMPT